jgi:surfactin synthase thioesterase subunit
MNMHLPISSHDLSAMPMNPRLWLQRQPGGARSMRLFCFSHAGGSAAGYRSWQAGLDPSIEVCAVQLPGRGARLGEPALRSLPLLVRTLARIVAGQDDMPFAFFGHSLGGLLAFELARYCQAEGLAMPEQLFVSGSAAPRCRLLRRRLHELDDADLIDALRTYQGAPAEALENAELMALMLPTIRADFALAADYEYRIAAPLDIPITVLGGAHDPHVPFKHLHGWQAETTEPVRLHCFEGDHFFIQSERDALLACLDQELRQLLGVAA